ncbi:hypothetical protein HAV15_002637 [Penicillium sp. str. |nr:hypothetical protein HAV15_002637 [Penicillium sp. str. \
MPYQSFWALYGQNIRQEGVEVLGDKLTFAKYAHTTSCTTSTAVRTMCTSWLSRRRTSSLAEWAGPQEIVFLHTAGSDSRQYHGVMNDPRMRAQCTMIAFDLPSHGRSFPSPAYPLGGHFNSEDAYLECVAGVIKALKLKQPILCGASMAGQACIAAAIRAEEVGIKGSIPHAGTRRTPTAPAENRKLLWHTYSAQSYGVYHADLDFYFNGWDGHGHVGGDGREDSEAKFKRMPILGHFSTTENPRIFVPHLLEAIDHIAATVEN